MRLGAARITTCLRRRSMAVRLAAAGFGAVLRAMPVTLVKAVARAAWPAVATVRAKGTRRAKLLRAGHAAFKARGPAMAVHGTLRRAVMAASGLRTARRAVPAGIGTVATMAHVLLTMFRAGTAAFIAAWGIPACIRLRAALIVALRAMLRLLAMGLRAASFGRGSVTAGFRARRAGIRPARGRWRAIAA